MRWTPPPSHQSTMSELSCFRCHNICLSFAKLEFFASTYSSAVIMIILILSARRQMTGLVCPQPWAKNRPLPLEHTCALDHSRRSGVLLYVSRKLPLESDVLCVYVQVRSCLELPCTRNKKTVPAMVPAKSSSCLSALAKQTRRKVVMHVHRKKSATLLHYHTNHSLPHHSHNAKAINVSTLKAQFQVYRERSLTKDHITSAAQCYNTEIQQIQQHHRHVDNNRYRSLASKLLPVPVFSLLESSFVGQPSRIQRH